MQNGTIIMIQLTQLWFHTYSKKSIVTLYLLEERHTKLINLPNKQHVYNIIMCNRLLFFLTKKFYTCYSYCYDWN